MKSDIRTKKNWKLKIFENSIFLMEILEIDKSLKIKKILQKKKKKKNRKILKSQKFKKSENSSIDIFLFYSIGFFTPVCFPK